MKVVLRQTTEKLVEVDIKVSEEKFNELLNKANLESDINTIYEWADGVTENAEKMDIEVVDID